MRYCYVLSNDLALLKRKIEDVRQGYMSNAGLDCNTLTFWGDELNPAFWDCFSAISLEARKDFIILRKAEALKADDWKKLSEVIARMQEDIFLLICIESPWEKNAPKVPAIISSQKCYTFAKKKNWFFQEAPLNAQNIRNYIVKGLKERNIEMQEEVLKILVSVLAPPSSSIDNALDQLALIAIDKKIEEKDFAHLSASVPELVIFDYIKCLESGTSYPLWQGVLNENKPDDILFTLLAILAREARTLWKLSVGEDVKLSPFIANSKKQLAYRLGKDGIAKLFSLLSDADWAIKSGKKDVGQVLEELIFRLSYLYRVQG